MKTTYDPVADAKYVRIKTGKIEKTVEIFPWLLLDTNSKQEVLGVEILNASQNLVSVTTQGKRLREIGLVSLEAHSSESKPLLEGIETTIGTQMQLT